MNCTQLKRLAMVASLFWGGLHAHAQATFNVAHYNVSSGFAAGRSVRQVPNGYIVFGLQTQPDTTGQDCTVTLFDSAGELEQDIFFPKPRIESYGDGADPISSIPWSSGFLSGISTYMGGEPLDTIWSVRFNMLGDTLWTKPILIDTFAYVRKAVAFNHRFYFTGMDGNFTTLPYSAYAMRTDTLANIEFFQRYPQMEARSIAVDLDGNMYLAGTASSKGYLLKIDSLGNELWAEFQPKPKGNWWGVKHVFGNKLLCMGEWKTYNLPPPGQPYDNTMYLVMYDDNGNFQWQYSGLKCKPTSYTWATFTDGYQDSDSTFIVCGAIQQVYWNRAVIYRFTANGDSLWRRDYAHFANLANIYPEIPWDIEPTSDGGMVLTGETWNRDTIPPISDVNMWLLKLDSMGCLVPGCQYVGINEIAYGLEHALRVWPNPSSGRINLALDLPEGLPLEGHLLLQVFDARGRLVVRRDLGDQLARTITLDLTGQPSGLYTAHISDAQRILNGAKIILE